MKTKKQWNILLLGMLSLGLTSCGGSEHTHTYREATCTEASVCTECGAVQQEARGHACNEATCTEPAVCQRCGELVGGALGHEYGEATCTEAKICERCGLTEGEALGHEYREATCAKPRTCERCGIEEGEALGHILTEATCTEAAVCERCMESVGEPLGHDLEEATCVKAAVCKRCGEKEGEPLGHEYSGLSCTESSVCARCGHVQSGPLGHSYYKGPCKRCGDTNGPLTPEEGKLFTRRNNLTDEQNALALAVAREIAAYVLETCPNGTDLEKVALATMAVSTFAMFCEYTMQGNYYSQAYGVFVAGECSCAGVVRAIGLVLSCLGYEWTHVNENQYTHQWVVLMMDGQMGYTDGQYFVGYGEYPMQ